MQSAWKFAKSREEGCAFREVARGGGRRMENSHGISFPQFWRGSSIHELFFFVRSLLRRGNEELHVRKAAEIFCDGSPKERIHPTENILFPDGSSQDPHSDVSLVMIHAEGLIDRTGNTFHIVRVDQQGAMMQLSGGAGELAQDEGSVFIGAACTVLLRNQVHPIFEWCHESDFAGTVVSRKLGSGQ